MELHKIVDEALAVGESGSVDFKLLRDLLHGIIQTFHSKVKIEIDQPNKTETNVSTAGKFGSEMMNLAQRVETLDDIVSRIRSEETPKANTAVNLRQIEERITAIEEHVAAQTSAISDITRAYSRIENQIFGEFDEIENIKESLDDLRHHLIQEKESKQQFFQKFEEEETVTKGSNHSRALKLYA